MGLDAVGRYAGLIPVSAAHAADDPQTRVGRLAILRDAHLTPQMTIKTIMGVFDSSAGDDLAVLDAEGRVLGLLSEAHAVRRYAEELEKARRDLVGRD